MMTMQEIHSALSERFPGAVEPFQAPSAGDVFIKVVPEHFHEVCLFLRDDPAMRFDLLRLISGVDKGDKVSGDKLSSVYHVFSIEQGHGVVLHVDLERAAPNVASVADIWPAADWHEREAYDMVGIIYEGHPDLRRILLPDDWEGYPLRKDYVAPKEYHGLTNE
jgi:NADH-quinone oxidoreductase subunit C